MITTRFHARTMVVSAWTEYANGTRAVLTFPSAMLAVDGVVEMLNEIEAAEARDVANHGEALAGRPWERYEVLGPLATRTRWRIGSYVVFLANLEGILREEYRGLRETLRMLRRETSEYKLKDDPRVRARRTEVGEVRRLRNKVFAHTVFAYPQDDDSASDGPTSLTFFGGQAASYSPTGVAVGGIGIIVRGEPTALSKQTTLAMVSGVASHVLGEWFTMFDEVIGELATTNDADWEDCARRVFKFLDASGASHPAVSIQMTRRSPRPSAEPADGD